MTTENSQGTAVSTNKFLADALALTSAPIITQMFGFFIIPIITHLYSPEAFGFAAAYNSIVSLFGAIVTFSYNGAIVLSKDETEKNHLFILSLVSTFTVSLLSLMLMLLFSSEISALINVPNINSILWLVPISVLIWGVMQSLRSLNIREGRFKNLALSGILKVFSNNGLVLSVGYFLKPYNFVLIFGQAFGGVISTLILFRFLSLEKIKTIIKTISIRNILFFANKHKQFALIATPQNFVSRFVAEIPTFAMIYYFSSSILGFYALGMRVLSIPITLISSSISEVFLQREGPNSKINSKSLEKTFSFLFIVGILPFLVLGISGKTICTFVFGVSWETAGIYLQILSFYIFMQYMCSLTSSIAVILRKQQINLLFSIINGFLILVSLVIGGLAKNELIGFGLMSFLGGLSYLWYAFIVLKQIKFSLRIILQNIKPYFILSSGLFSILLLIHYFDVHSTLIVIADIITLVVYFIYVFKTQEDLNVLLLSKFNNRFRKN